MNETPKQKAIREAYGEYWDKIKGDVNLDGWTGMDSWFRFIGHTIDYECKPNDFYQSHRPFCLKGTENNRGWLSVKEHGLPKEHGTYFAYSVEQKILMLAFNESELDMWIRRVSHYQPIVKPLPPIY